MKIDTRTFKYAGSSADSNGTFKARFANDFDLRMERMSKTGYTHLVLVELPKPMLKLDAIAYLRNLKPEGVNLDALAAKEAYINKQLSKINGTYVPGKRGRRPKNAVQNTASVTVSNSTNETPAPDSIVKTIVNTARGNSIRAKAAAQAAKVAAAKK